MRVGQKNKLTYRWAGKARVPRPFTISVPNQAMCSARYAPSVEPALHSCCPLATPRPCSSISTRSQRKSPTGAHAVLILDQAGWHGAKDLKAAKNISLLPLLPRAPELNPQENIWQFPSANWLSNRIFKSFDDIVDHCSYA
jgi:DDE superfamily endonuclease